MAQVTNSFTKKKISILVRLRVISLDENFKYENASDGQTFCSKWKILFPRSDGCCSSKIFSIFSAISGFKSEQTVLREKLWKIWRIIEQNSTYPNLSYQRGRLWLLKIVFLHCHNCCKSSYSWVGLPSEQSEGGNLTLPNWNWLLLHLWQGLRPT